MDFCHLHTHTQYSLLDGHSKVEELVLRAKELNQTSMAITDHGTLSGLIDFYKECKKNDIKPILGCEFYIADNMKEKSANKYNHIILLAKNEVGLKNLYSLSAISSIEGFYYKPRIDRNILEKYSEGIICLSACIQGKIPWLLLHNDPKGAKEETLFYKNLFKDDFYIELQNHNLKSEETVLPLLITLAQEVQVKCVCTNDIHYVNKSDAVYQDILMCIQMQKKLSDENRLTFETQEYYLKSYEEMLQQFPNMDSYLLNSLEISNKCNVEIKFHQFSFPKFFVDKSKKETQEYLKEQCEYELTVKYKNGATNEILNRLNYELDTINEMGFCDYFLIVSDFVRYAKRNDIAVGPGRGSAAGSLVSYLLDITTVDPIKYNLVFERFLNKQRVSMPDIDIDFCYERRNEVIEYVIKKYGADRVAQILTFGTLKARAAIKDVARVMGIPYYKADEVSKFIPNFPTVKLKEIIVSTPVLKNMYDSDFQVKEWLDISMKIEGHLRHCSVHAAGVLITGEKTQNLVPVTLVNDTIVTQYEMGTLEELGLLKMDFLGLRNITVVHHTIREVQRQYGITIDFSNMDYDDENVYKMFSKGDTDGVFQFESSGMRRFLQDLKPQVFTEIIAAISLFRPGPAAKIPEYIENKNNISKIKYDDEKLIPILTETHGCIVYQEQVMEIFRTLAGYSLGQADIIRRAISKKKHEVITKEKEKFILGCENRGVSEEVAQKVFSEIASFASYAFNKSHGTCYSVIAYQTAYLKYYYPQIFYSELINAYVEYTTKVAFYIKSAKERGIKTLPPRINRSQVVFTALNSNIIFGFSAIKGVGRNLAELICTERERFGDFKSFDDFVGRMIKHKINRLALESLIKSGCFDNFGRREEFLKVFEIKLEGLLLNERNNNPLQIGFSNCGFKEIIKEDNYTFYEEEDIIITPKELEMEREVLGLYISGHPLDEFIEVINSITKLQILDIDSRISQNSDIPNELLGEIIIVGIVKDVSRRTTKTGRPFMLFKIEDISGTCDCISFHNCVEQYGQYIVNDNIVILKCKITMGNDDKWELIVNSVENFKRKKIYTKLYLKIDEDKVGYISEIKKILAFFKGDTPTYFYYPEKKETFLSPREFWIRENVILLEKLEGILGKDNVKLII